MDKIILGSNIRRFMNLTTDANTIKLLSSKSQVSTASISNILNGKTNPTADVLLKLAAALNQTTDALLKPMPVLKTVRFRTNKKMSAREKAQKDTLLCTAAEWMNAYSVFSETSPMENKYKDLLEISEKDPIKAAKKVRQIWKLNEKDPVYNIENYIVNSGIKLLGIPFGFKQTFGLSIGKEDGGPAIIVNTDATISGERRIFTLAHELGHIILHKDSFGKNIGEIESSDSPDEKDANVFASHLLMPEDAFFEKLIESKNLGMVEAVLKIKRHFKVSYKTVLYRYCDMTGARYADVAHNFAKLFNQKYHHNLQNHYEPFSLGEYEFTNTCAKENIFSAVKGNKISLPHAGFLLGMSKSDAETEYDFWKEERFYNGFIRTQINDTLKL